MTITEIIESVGTARFTYLDTREAKDWLAWGPPKSKDLADQIRGFEMWSHYTIDDRAMVAVKADQCVVMWAPDEVLSSFWHGWWLPENMAPGELLQLLDALKVK